MAARLGDRAPERRNESRRGLEIRQTFARLMPPNFSPTRVISRMTDSANGRVRRASGRVGVELRLLAMTG